ncbi:hypothetical protein LXA43DRAFT_311467 [Ganoderma leucocontextum]|nr:hypothetical protein LXA43DRAFT_311467 [Ganoderma leucocontextum]
MASEQPTRPVTPPPEHVSDMFSLSSLATLRTFIPNDLLPDDLLVHDPDNITNLCLDRSQPQPDAPVRYVRIFPNLKASGRGGGSQQSAFASRSPDHPVRTAHLYLKADNTLGAGSHSTVYSAPLRLRLNAESVEESTVRVAAKTACAECGAHWTLHQEAAIYNAFPRHLMDDQYPAGTIAKAASVKSDAAAQLETESGPQTDAAATASEVASTDVGEKRITVPLPKPRPAVVPKFYGYYAAVDADGSVVEHSHSFLFCGPDDVCSVRWPTRILLMEECGKPIVPEHYTIAQRANCLKLVKRLHAAGFVQNSMYVRNVLVQPGPLCAPPEERSDATPSFRIIDFGRGEVFSHLPPGCEAYRKGQASCKEEEWKAKDRVLLGLS